MANNCIISLLPIDNTKRNPVLSACVCSRLSTKRLRPPCPSYQAVFRYCGPSDEPTNQHSTLNVASGHCPLSKSPSMISRDLRVYRSWFNSTQSFSCSSVWQCIRRIGKQSTHSKGRWNHDLTLQTSITACSNDAIISTTLSVLPSPLAPPPRPPCDDIETADCSALTAGNVGTPAAAAAENIFFLCRGVSSA